MAAWTATEVGEGDVGVTVVGGGDVVIQVSVCQVVFEVVAGKKRLRTSWFRLRHTGTYLYLLSGLILSLDVAPKIRRVIEVDPAADGRDVVELALVRRGGQGTVGGIVLVQVCAKH